MTAGPLLAASLELLAHHQNVARLSLYIGITLVYVHLNWLNWFHFLILKRGILIILIDGIISLSPLLDVTRKSVNSFFPCLAKLGNSLSIECFPLASDLSGFKSRIKRDL